MTEEQLLVGILAMARAYGWRTLHIRPARTAVGWRTPVQGDGAGFPDLVALRGKEIVVAELKSDRGRVEHRQREWLEAWRDVGASVHLWRPGDYPEAMVEAFR